MSSSSSPRKRRTKSGCRTCRIRKVKCDETFPSCRRCLDTGRSCDGYGIWGGGIEKLGSARTLLQRSETHNLRRTPPSQPLIHLARSVDPFNVSHDEQRLLEWFRFRTAFKLRGSYSSDFWTRLLIQSSMAESAILHAVLALSSLHRGGILSQRNESVIADSIPDKIDHSALDHYIKSIRHLQPHFISGDKAARRVALIACIVFTSLDFLRGHFQTAFMHMESGINLLSAAAPIASYSSLTKPGIFTGTGCDYIDGAIEEMFSRIHLQVGLIKYLNEGASIISLPPIARKDDGGILDRFLSVKEAWRRLGSLIMGAIDLSGRAKDYQEQYDSAAIGSLDLVNRQRVLHQHLRHWLVAYRDSRKTSFRLQTVDEQKADGILMAYQIMATIMAAASLHSGDEMIYDRHTDDFVRLTSHILKVATISLPQDYPAPTPTGLSFDMSRSITDMGCIVPLYFTALKCRVQCVRAQAVAFLEATFHREGVWDAIITSLISRKVLELEGMTPLIRWVPGQVEAFSAASGDGGVLLSCVPESRRLRDVKITLLGEPVNKVSLCYRRMRDDHDMTEAFIEEYNLHTQSWMAKSADCHGPDGIMILKHMEHLTDRHNSFQY